MIFKTTIFKSDQALQPSNRLISQCISKSFCDKKNTDGIKISIPVFFNHDKTIF